MGIDELWINKDNQRRSGALRESSETDTNNAIPERKLEPTSISTEMNHAHKWPSTDLPEHPPGIDDKNNQGEDPNSESSIPVDKGTIHLISLLLFDTPFYTFFSSHPHETPQCSRALHIIPEDSRTLLFLVTISHPLVNSINTLLTDSFLTLISSLYS
jgi:hypothetical protein